MATAKRPSTRSAGKTKKTLTRSKLRASVLPATTELFEDVHLEDVSDADYYKYGAAVIEDRAIFGDDGLKPVARRSLWAAHLMGLHSSSKPDKAAKVVGETLGNYHPHGDLACLRGSTLVPLLNGKTVTIKSLADACAGKRWVLAFDRKANRMVPAIAHSWREAKITDRMIRLTMSSGETQEVTYDHPFLSVKRKWVEAQYLKVGEALVGGTLVPRMEYPDVATNTGFRRRIHSIVGDFKFQGLEDDEVYHHRDEDTKNNRPSNIEVLTHDVHAAHHQDYLDGLAEGRKRMFGPGKSKMRKAIAQKNSTMMHLHNENLWMLKAVKAVRLLIERKLPLTVQNYEALRGEIYNLTRLATVAERGYTFEALCAVAPTFKLDLSEAVGLTVGLTKSADRHVRTSPEYKLGMPHSFFDQVSLVLGKLLKRLPVAALDWDAYSAAVQKMPSMRHNASKVMYSKPEVIQERFGVESVEQFCNALPACVLNVIVKIEHVQLEEAETFYDFSVEKYKNMIVLTSDGLRTGNFNVAHNCYGAIVTCAKTPVRMIDGEGNWGTMLDGPAAMRYTNMRLSIYSDLIFFDKFYLPTIAYVPNYDGSRKEPLILPTLLPNSIINGNFGIAPGVNTRCPSYTLKSVFEVLRKTLTAGACTPEMCMSLAFTTKYGGKVVRSASNRAERAEFYKTGKGTFKFVSSASEPDAQHAIRIDEWAPISSLANSLKAVDAMPGVVETLNDSDKKDKHEVAYKVFFSKSVKGPALEALIKKVMVKFSCTQRFSIQTTDRFVDPTGLGAAKLRPTTVPELINKWMNDRLTLERNACAYWIEKRTVEIADLNLLRLAVKMRDFIITAIKEKEKLSDDDLAIYIAKGLKVTVEQANRILDLRIRQLRALEDRKLVDKIAALTAEAKTFEGRRKAPKKYVLSSLDALEVALQKMPQKPKFK